MYVFNSKSWKKGEKGIFGHEWMNPIMWWNSLERTFSNDWWIVINLHSNLRLNFLANQYEWDVYKVV
jgi:hypothetical protein